MTYPEAVSYLNSFVNYERTNSFRYCELKLERIKNLLRLLGNPQGELQVLHIAGTKGKGSTCAIVTYILRQAGYKVGLYTSPHLLDFRERIRILRPFNHLTNYHLTKTDFEGMISKDELIDLIERLRPAIESYNKNSKYGPLSFFEIYTALAFMYFKEEKVDFAVLETGLGGRLDATNVTSPLVSGITQISFEHTEILGKTLREIAREKAGIIKHQKPVLRLCSGLALSKVEVPETRNQKPVVVTSPQEKEVLEVIRQRCKECRAKLYKVGRDILFEEIDSNQEKQRFNLKGIFGEYPNLTLRLIGSHQLINAATAIGLIEALTYWDVVIPKEAIRRGIEETRWPGRLEIIDKSPLIILDGAQNVASSIALKEAIKKFFKYKNLILILGISKDKDIYGICRELTPLSDEVILTKADNPRAAEPREIKKLVNNQTVLTHSVKEAIDLARGKAKEEDLILITGSLFVVGEARGYIVKSERLKV